jgi:hypothetical protein
MLNIFVTATKSGMTQKEIYKHFLCNIIKPYEKKDKFILILDSWGGHTNPALYHKKFLYENDKPTYSLKIILQKCTPLCQPCNVYFYRYVKDITVKNF